ncbi:hypothetical protein PN462_01655 [Spirulina sp. CS-785/01]|uniref:hypothetical protein n=1 Tax=Spirulina sp. CS-785/01 TaxID=3021716 RepID=UPI00232E5E3E|nr:hypothetical protein [Spirulina sp. CS-785/01]MDB9311790.1 hypothetical protein [Spirulina sp. CS-785/01]
MVNIGYRSARLKGKLARHLYEQNIDQRLRVPIENFTRLNCSVYCLSCARDFPEQVANIRSFFKYVGIPEKYVVVADGYSLEQQKFLYQLHACLKVVPLPDFIGQELPQQVYDYAASNGMGKKLATILSIPIGKGSIYTDSDVLFFPGGGELTELINANDTQSYYLPDADPAFDLRILQETERDNPVNGGFILFKHQPDWSLAMERFLNLQDPPNYFTEQTMMHLTLHRDNAKPLPKDKYIMWRDDEFIFRDRYAKDTTVLRHYVTPVRHKFWCNWQYLA